MADVQTGYMVPADQAREGPLDVLRRKYPQGLVTDGKRQSWDDVEKGINDAAFAFGKPLTSK